MDPCYSKGNFYKEINRPEFCFDIFPAYDYVKKCDCRHLPFDKETIKSLIYDPPFLATTGKSLTSDDNNNIINKRFGVYPSELELFHFYEDSIKELGLLYIFNPKYKLGFLDTILAFSINGIYPANVSVNLIISSPHLSS